MSDHLAKVIKLLKDDTRRTVYKKGDRTGRRPMIRAHKTALLAQIDIDYFHFDVSSKAIRVDDMGDIVFGTAIGRSMLWHNASQYGDDAFDNIDASLKVIAQTYGVSVSIAGITSYVIIVVSRLRDILSDIRCNPDIVERTRMSVSDLFYGKVMTMPVSVACMFHPSCGGVEPDKYGNCHVEIRLTTVKGCIGDKEYIDVPKSMLKLSRCCKEEFTKVVCADN